MLPRRRASWIVSNSFRYVETPRFVDVVSLVASGRRRGPRAWGRLAPSRRGGAFGVGARPCPWPQLARALGTLTL